MLTDEQCNEFRRLPGSFNNMVRAIYAAGREQAIEECVQLVDSLWMSSGITGAACDIIASRLRALKEKA